MLLLSPISLPMQASFGYSPLVHHLFSFFDQPIKVFAHCLSLFAYPALIFAACLPSSTHRFPNFFLLPWNGSSSQTLVFKSNILDYTFDYDFFFLSCYLIVHVSNGIVKFTSHYFIIPQLEWITDHMNSSLAISQQMINCETSSLTCVHILAVFVCYLKPQCNLY